jgi:putative holliday junction resolvase
MPPESIVLWRSLVRPSASARRMRVLGLDIGEKRIGVAVSDPSGSVATPVVVLDARPALGDGRDLVRLAEDYEVGPLSMDGSEGSQAARVRSAGERVARFLRVPIEYHDERLSSVSARRAMTEAGVSDRDKRGSLDMVAAALFLQSYLDQHAKPDTSRDD